MSQDSEDEAPKTAMRVTVVIRDSPGPAQRIDVASGTPFTEFRSMFLGLLYTSPAAPPEFLNLKPVILTGVGIQPTTAQGQSVYTLLSLPKPGRPHGPSLHRKIERGRRGCEALFPFSILHSPFSIAAGSAGADVIKLAWHSPSRSLTC